MIRNLVFCITLQALCTAFTASGRAAWKMAIEHLKSSREIVVFNAADVNIDILFPIEDHGDHSFLIYTRDLAVIKQTLHSSMKKDLPKEIEAEPIGYFCIVNNAAGAKAIIADLGEHSARAKIVIYTEKEITNLEEILWHAWKTHSMMDVVVIRSHENIISLSVLNPFEKVGDSDWGLVHTFVANDGNASTVLKTAERMMGNRLMDMQMYPLNVTFIEAIVVAEKVYDENGEVIGYTGVDVFLQSCLAERMRYRPILNNPRDNERYGYKDEDGHFRGALGDIEYKYTALSANMRPVIDYGTSFTAFSKPIKHTRLCYLAPKYYPLAPTIPLGPSLDNPTKMATMATVLLCAILWYLLRKYYYKLDPPGFWKTLRDTLRLLISTKIDQPSNVLERLLFLVIAYFSFLMINIYPGQIIARFTSPGPSRDIHSLQDLDESGLAVGVIYGVYNPNAKRYSADGIQTVYDRLLRKEIFVQTLDHAKNGAVAGTTATLLPETFAQSYVNNVYSEDNGMDLLHIVEECPFSRYSAYIVPKTSPFIDRINVIILRLHSCGIMRKWEQDSLFRIEMARIRRTYKYVEAGSRKFTLFYYWTAFTVYSMCIGVSIMIFIAELIYDKWNGNRSVGNNSTV